MCSELLQTLPKLPQSLPELFQSSSRPSQSSPRASQSFSRAPPDLPKAPQGPPRAPPEPPRADPEPHRGPQGRQSRPEPILGGGSELSSTAPAHQILKFGTHPRIYRIFRNLPESRGSGVISRSSEPPSTRAGGQDDGSYTNSLK